ncbi:MAG: PaaI family thioesterase [Pseudomonadota bacterium]
MTSTSAYPVNGNALNLIDRWCGQSQMTKWIDFKAKLDDGQLGYTQTFAEKHVGNDLSRFYHGGVVSTFLQLCAFAEAIGRVPQEVSPKIISIHCNYLRAAGPVDLNGKVLPMQIGRRVAFLDAVCWQSDEQKPIARAAVALRLR